MIFCVIEPLRFLFTLRNISTGTLFLMGNEIDYTMYHFAFAFNQCGQPNYDRKFKSV